MWPRGVASRRESRVVSAPLPRSLWAGPIWTGSTHITNILLHRVYIYIYYMHRERETIVMYQNAVKYNCSYRSLRSLPKALLLSHGTTPKSSSHNLPIRTWVRDPHHRICQIVDDCIIIITHDGSMVLVYIYMLIIYNYHNDSSQIIIYYHSWWLYYELSYTIYSQ